MSNNYPSDPYNNASGYGAGSPYGSGHSGNFGQSTPYGQSAPSSYDAGGTYNAGYGNAPQQGMPYPQTAVAQQVAVPPGFGQPRADGTVPLNEPWYGIGFMDATKRFFKKYVRFNGFASRGEYWWASLSIALIFLIPVVLIIIGYFVMISGMFVGAASYQSGSTGAGGGAAAGFGFLITMIGVVLNSLIGFGVMLPMLGVTIRRLHDAGYSGWWYLLSLVPGGSIAVLIFTILPTNQEKWQPDWFDQNP